MHRITNYDDLASTPMRRHALDIIEAGLEAIDTETIIRRSVSYENNELSIGDVNVGLDDVRNVHVIGFGKASCQAAQTIEGILGSRISSGLVIGNTPTSCEVITTYEGTHPRPSRKNVAHSGQMLTQINHLSDKDIVIVLVSGGGSALLCWPQTECDQGLRLYEASVHNGMSIQELNTVRKHISLLKGGGLAKLLYPARIISLIFSDVPGTEYDMVASGPTYPDKTTISDAQSIIEKYALGRFDLKETPKETKWFDRVTNIVLVSNHEALDAMASKADSLGYEPEIISTELYMEPKVLIQRMLDPSEPKTAILAGGEYRFRINGHSGKGGRNQQSVLKAMDMIGENQVFISIASDGLDNSDAAGAIADAHVREGLPEDKIKEHLAAFDAYPILKQVEALIMTGPTQSNVSDLSLLLTE